MSNEKLGEGWRIGREEVGKRVDWYLMQVVGECSRGAIQRLVMEGGVLINGKVSKPGYRLRENDEIAMVREVLPPVQRGLMPRDIPLDIVYEDEDVLVVNKAAGMVVHPAAGHSNDTLVNALVAYAPDVQRREGDSRPGIVHRLDRDTSGLIIVAKNVQTQAALVQLMKGHEVEKCYIALVEGIVLVEKGSIDAPIGRDRRNRQKMGVTVFEGREACTHFKVLKRFVSHTLVEVRLETGRTHQIRVHFAAIGHPIAGDEVYGSGRMQRRGRLDRQFLHAYRLRFLHPTTGEGLELETPLPWDLWRVLASSEDL